jgi:hypothetical protein
MTQRQEYWNNLSFIADVYGELNRRMSFVEASTWASDFEYYESEGYPNDLAAQYAYDHFHTNKKGVK